MRLGQRSQAWMNGRTHGRYATVPQQVLEFDHRRNRGSAVLAKKTALGTMLPCDGLRPPRAPERRIGDLLADIGELPRRELRRSGWGSRLRRRFGDALLMLQDTGVLDGVEWPAGFEPGQVDDTRGWVDAWLASKIVLRRAGVPHDCGASATRSVRGTRGAASAAAGPAQLRRGSVIRSMRIARGISQRRLAGELGISASYLSQIENERRMASQAVLERIACWARTNNETDRDGRRAPNGVVMIETAGKRQLSFAGKQQQMAGSPFVQARLTATPIGKDDRP